MKKLIITTIALFLALPLIGNIKDTPEYTNIVIKDKNHNHTQWNIPADMPDVYYNYVSGTITIVDYANVTYYVTIYDYWWNAVITDTKVGGGTIDVSSLISGDYTLEITTSWNNQYEGEFTVP